MPYVLEGIDATIVAVFQAVGVYVEVKPIFENDIFIDEDVSYLGRRRIDLFSPVHFAFRISPLDFSPTTAFLGR